MWDNHVMPFPLCTDKRVANCCTSEWSVPIIVIGKKAGTLQLCIYYRWLNNITCADMYPMPRVDELLDKIGQEQYITTLDLTRRYWQVPVAEELCSKMAFSKPLGLYQFKVMPIGLCEAPAMFQRLMDQLLHAVETFMAAYSDDVVIYSDCWEDHQYYILLFSMG